PHGRIVLFLSRVGVSCAGDSPHGSRVDLMSDFRWLPLFLPFCMTVTGPGLRVCTSAFVLETFGVPWATALWDGAGVLETNSCLIDKSVRTYHRQKMTSDSICHLRLKPMSPRIKTVLRG